VHLVVSEALEAEGTKLSERERRTLTTLTASSTNRSYTLSWT